MLVLLTCMMMLGVDAYNNVYDLPGADYADLNVNDPEVKSLITEYVTIGKPPKESIQMLKESLQQILPHYDWNEHFKTALSENPTTTKSTKQTTTKRLLEKLENSEITRFHWQIPIEIRPTINTTKTLKLFETTPNKNTAFEKFTNYRRTMEPIDLVHDVWSGTNSTRSSNVPTRTRKIILKIRKTIPNNRKDSNLASTANVGRSREAQWKAKELFDNNLTVTQNGLASTTNIGTSHDAQGKPDEIYDNNLTSTEDDLPSTTNVGRLRDTLGKTEELCDNNLTTTKDDDAAMVLIPDEDLRKHFDTTESDADYIKNLTGVLMGKCYVCGLTDEKIPYDSACKDGFAGDFLSIFSVDHSATGRIKSFKHFCRWKNIRGYELVADAKTMSGRWTGGCSVRWVDVTGVYTQRTCRNRHRPIMGNHWASKRMAKLERALERVDDGCIISPTASLLPLSRAISLYARFHVCVCSGYYCNAAVFSQQWSAYTTVFTFVLSFLWCN